jgi:heavy metal translocating P-type ATPase
VDEALKSCAHCGLPAHARFCCYGCELAHAITAEARDDHAQLYGTFAFTLVLAMVVMMLSLFLYAEDVFDAGADVEMAWLRSAYRWASWVLATPVLALAGLPLLRRRLSMDLLIGLGAFAAYALSVYSLFAHRRGIFFDSAATAVVLASFGRYLEASARSRASRSLGPLVEVTRGKVRVHGSARAIAPAEIEPGMILEIDPEQVVPVDVVLENDVEVELAILTGESRPVERRRGQTVPAGAVPASTMLIGRALSPARDSALERLSQLARSLSERPSAALRWADRFARWLTPAVTLIALAALVYWTRTSSLERGIVAALAVALAACPCSYAIATPLVHWKMLERAFSRGVLVRSVEALEALARVRVVAFDKTGTLTRPELTVAREELCAPREQVYALAHALEAGSAHPVARALVRHTKKVAPAVVSERRFLIRGVEARDAQGRRLELTGRDGAIALLCGDTLLARFVLDEELRPEAHEAIALLRAQHHDLVLLSGDDRARVDRIAAALGITGHARLAPEDKLSHLDAVTAMVGDGVNDAPALAGRLTSFTLGGAAQLAKGVAQVTLLEPDLRLVPWTLALARRGVGLVKWLIGASTAYNLVFIALAAGGALKPVWAGLSMLLSSLLAVGFAASLAHDHPAEKPLEPVPSC